MEKSDKIPDETSSKPVSTLLSKFESLGRRLDNAREDLAPHTSRLSAQSFQTVQSNSVSPAHTNRSIPTTPALKAETRPRIPQKLQPDALRSRPLSMISVRASQYSTPTVTIDSPAPEQNVVQGRFETGGAVKSVPAENKEIPVANMAQSSHDGSVGRRQGQAAGAPPVNRAAKHKLNQKMSDVPRSSDALAVAESAPDASERSISPFSTPPGSGASSPGSQEGSKQRERVDSDASWVQRLRGDSDASMATRTRAESSASWVEQLNSPKLSLPPPTHHTVAAKRGQHANGAHAQKNTSPDRFGRYTSGPKINHAHDSGPRLPARPELQMRSGRTSPAKMRGSRSSPTRSLDLPRRENTFDANAPNKPLYSVNAFSKSALNQGFAPSQGFARPSQDVLKMPPAVPSPRRSMDRRRDLPSEASSHTQHEVEKARDKSHTDLRPVPSSTHPLGPSDFPDATRTSRRPPRYKQRPWQIPTDYDTRLLAVSAEYVCTTGYITKAWSLRTGEQMLDMPHQETVRVTSMIFKPAINSTDESNRLWLGTSAGEIQEIDIPSQSIVNTSQKAHRGREIIKMYNQDSHIWTLDESGELVTWKGDQSGRLSLDSPHASFRVTKGHSYSIACDGRLWIATGKDIRVYAPTSRTDAEFCLTQRPLTQSNVGEVTSGAFVASHPNQIYFGHTDGKVSVYDRQTLGCVGVIYVSLYKINALVGVGEYLWAGYGTGMTYVYDTTKTPWQVKKDWQAHDKQICSIAADTTTLRKHDRLQVVSLATDNMLCVWDGLLEADWLDSRMQQRDSEYCSFREVSISILSWNAGATKPNNLQHSQEDNQFLGNYLRRADLPDMFVFGFQELVDLEDKKLTAKSLFKSKKKDASEQENMSHQYRAWRDHLSRCVQEHMPTDQPYTVLHSASLIGLFTCVFVKVSLRNRIKHVHQAEVKRGMGGHYGNKGALVLRLVLDDSSICFLNCHLAAGQTQTASRNNDIAAILESDALPAYPLANNSEAVHNDVFTSGGDGSMILDHEICVLNGDLNYRIDTMGRDTVIKHIQQGKLERLLERDQLLLSRKKNPGFRLRAFQENKITFNPTYKYNVRSDVYDSSEKRRAPAWCDRILYRGWGKVKCDEYRRWEVKVSDHRPVSARLKCRVKTVDPARRERAWQQCVKDFEAHKQQIRQFLE